MVKDVNFPVVVGQKQVVSQVVGPNNLQPGDAAQVVGDEELFKPYAFVQQDGGSCEMLLGRLAKRLPRRSNDGRSTREVVLSSVPTSISKSAVPEPCIRHGKNFRRIGTTHVAPVSKVLSVVDRRGRREMYNTIPTQRARAPLI